MRKDGLMGFSGQKLSENAPDDINRAWWQNDDRTAPTDRRALLRIPQKATDFTSRGKTQAIRGTDIFTKHWMFFDSKTL